MSALLSLVALAGMVAGCGSGGGAQPGGGQSGTAPGYPVTIENCGQTLTFQRPPSRAVLSYHPIAEMFVGLGLADRAIGRAGYQGAYEQPPLLPEQAEEFKGIPVVSRTSYPPPREELLSLRPDFLLAYGDFDYGGEHAGTQGLASLEELDAVGIDVYTVVCPREGAYDTGTLADTYRSILDLGKIFGVEDRARQQVGEMKRQIADVRARVADEPPVDVIAYAGGEGPLNILGGRSIYSQLIEAAGARNVFPDAPGYYQASREVVAASGADAFVIAANSTNSTGQLDASTEARVLSATFPNMNAGKQRRFAVTSFDYLTQGWRNAQTVEDLARQLHPRAFR